MFGRLYMESETVSITIKGINKNSKEKFETYCGLFGKTMTSVLINFIEGCCCFSENERIQMMYMTLFNFANTYPQQIDAWITEPIFQTMDEIQKSYWRLYYINLYPTYFFQKYVEWINGNNLQEGL